jgi:hypothetical protein
MAIDFPNSPSVNDTFTVGTRTWIWDGTTWELVATSSDPIQKTIVDAKGDLIAGTAADTPARVAVGTNGQVLTADSGETTGLKWSDAGKWTTFTPSWNNFTPGNAVETWKYCIVNKLIIVSGRTVLGSTSVMGTQPTMTLPASATAAIYSHGVLRVGDNDGEIYQGSCILAGPADTTIGLQIYRVVSTNVASAQINATTPMTWTTNDNLSFTIIGDIT